MNRITHILKESGSRNIGYAKFLVSLQKLIGSVAPDAWGDKSQIDPTSMKRIHNSLRKKYSGDYVKYNALLKTQKGPFGNWHLQEAVHEDFSKRDWDVKWKMPKDNLFNATKTTDAVKNRYKALQFLLKGRPKELRAFDSNDDHPAYDMSYDELMKWYNGLKEGVIREGKWMDLWDESQDKAPSAWTKHQKWIVANAERYGFDPVQVKKLLKQHTAIHNRTYGMFASVEDWMEEKLK